MHGHAQKSNFIFYIKNTFHSKSVKKTFKWQNSNLNFWRRLIGIMPGIKTNQNTYIKIQRLCKNIFMSPCYESLIMLKISLPHVQLNFLVNTRYTLIPWIKKFSPYKLHIENGENNTRIHLCFSGFFTVVITCNSIREFYKFYVPLCIFRIQFLSLFYQ